MQITLKQPELETAVRQYIQSMGISFPAGAVSFTPTRGNDGIVTEIELTSIQTVIPAGPIARNAPTLVDQAALLAEVESVLGGPVQFAPDTLEPASEPEIPASKKLFG